MHGEIEKRMKKGIYNIFFGIVSQIITVIMGLILPQMIVEQYGSGVNGLLSSVSQIFVYLALFEAGVGTATMQALYKLLQKKMEMESTEYYRQRTVILRKQALFMVQCWQPVPLFIHYLWRRHSLTVALL